MDLLDIVSEVVHVLKPFIPTLGVVALYCFATLLSSLPFWEKMDGKRVEGGDGSKPPLDEAGGD